MAFSLRKRVQSKKLHVMSGFESDSNILGEILHQSSKNSQSKKKKKDNGDSTASETLNHVDSDFESSRKQIPRSRSITYRTCCPCEKHYDKNLLDHEYGLNVDKMFELIFGSNEFVQTFRQAQRFFEERSTDWVRSDEKNRRQRVLNYKVPYESGFVGKAIVAVHEKQTIQEEVPGSHYIIESELSNQGVKFSDTFYLSIRYCLVQKSLNTTRISVTATVQFTKRVYSFIEQIIERNAYSASREGLKDLHNRLNLVSHFTIEKTRLSRTESAIQLSSTNFTPDHNSNQRNEEKLSVCDRFPSHEENSYGKSLFLLGVLIVLLLLMHVCLHLKLTTVDVLVNKLSTLIQASKNIQTDI